MNQRQGGGFLVGLVVGVLAGVLVALGIALYVTKMPVPFVNKMLPRSAAQDAAEAERNKNWDPNAPLAGRPRAPQAPASAPAAAGSAAPASPAAPAVGAAPARDPAAILAGKVPMPAVTGASAPLSTKAEGDPFLYFVQAGAYARNDEAEQQRGRLAMLGVKAKVTEREQGGRTVYRVRVGPFDTRTEAEGTRDKLTGDGVESALVRVNK